MENYKWNSGVQKADAQTNKIRNFVKDLFLTELKKKGFEEVDLPTLDYSDTFIINNEYYSAQNHFKTVSPNGEILSVGDDVIKGLISFSTKAVEKKGKLCASYDGYSFLVSEGQNPNEFQFGGIIYGESGIEEEADLIVAATDFASKIGVKKSKTEISDTNTLLGVLNRFSGKEESLDRVKAILSGKIENDIDYAASQTFNEVKNIEGDSTIIKEIAGKLDNQTSIDGLLNVFEIMNVLEAYNKAKNVCLKVGYVGEKKYDNGMVFRVLNDEGKVVVYGGRCDCMKGNDKIRCLYIRAKADECTATAFNADAYKKAEEKRVIVAIAETRTAIVKAFKVRNDLNNEGMITEVIYGAKRDDLFRLAEDNKNKVVIYIDEEGNISHS